MSSQRSRLDLVQREHLQEEIHLWGWPLSMGSTHGKELVAGAVYEFHRPDPGQRIEVEIIFMHGLQMGPGDLKDAYHKTWRTRDGSEVWPEKWLGEEYRKARILSLTYDSCARRMREAGNMTPFLLSETLLQQMVLPGVDIGQIGCPVIFVCHSLGGLIVKEIVVRCQVQKERKEYHNLLLNVKAFFFFATPHRGSDVADWMLFKLVTYFPSVNTSSLVEYLKPNGTAREQTHSEFISILRHENKDRCKIYVVAEGQETKIGPFRPSWVVPEISARFPGYADFVMLKDADHNTVCKPKHRNDTGYLKLTSCIDQVIKEYTSRLTVHPPVNPIGIEVRIARISEQSSAPQLRQQVQEESKGASYILAGLAGAVGGLAGAVAGLAGAGFAAYAYVIWKVFEREESLNRVQNDHQVIGRQGSPITGYDQENRNRAARQRISSYRIYGDEDGVERVENQLSTGYHQHRHDLYRDR